MKGRISIISAPTASLCGQGDPVQDLCVVVNTGRVDVGTAHDTAAFAILLPRQGPSALAHPQGSIEAQAPVSSSECVRSKCPHACRLLPSKWLSA